MSAKIEFSEEQSAELRKLGGEQIQALERVSGCSAGLTQIASNGTAADTKSAIENLYEATINLTKANDSLWEYLLSEFPHLNDEGEWKFNVQSWSLELVPPAPAANVSPETPAPAA